MTVIEIRAHVAAQSLPDGWVITPRVVREYRHRNEWALDVLHDGVRVTSFGHLYDVKRALPVVVRWIEGQVAMTVTTDAAGWVRSIEDAVA